MTTIKVAPVKPTISIDLLERIDIRVGTIKLVEDVKDSDKLIKMTVDSADHTRTILVGMKQEIRDPTDGSRWIVQVRPTRTRQREVHALANES